MSVTRDPFDLLLLATAVACVAFTSERQCVLIRQKYSQYRPVIYRGNDSTAPQVLDLIGAPERTWRTVVIGLSYWLLE